MSSGYAGCLLLAYAHDNYRDREVRIYRIPGAEDAVGITDGTDYWIAPVAPSLFSVDVRKIMRDLYDGIQPKPVKPEAKVARVRLKEDGGIKRVQLKQEGVKRVQLQA